MTVRWISKGAGRPRRTHPGRTDGTIIRHPGSRGLAKSCESERVGLCSGRNTFSLLPEGGHRLDASGPTGGNVMGCTLIRVFPDTDPRKHRYVRHSGCSQQPSENRPLGREWPLHESLPISPVGGNDPRNGRSRLSEGASIGLFPRIPASSTGRCNTRAKSFNRNVLAMRAARGLPTSGSH